ncbi:MAG: ABC transporter permease [Thermaerobacter sp.]|nr:ABC transporter permease [Thermaerobacter sp.]
MALSIRQSDISDGSPRRRRRLDGGFIVGALIVGLIVAVGVFGPFFLPNPNHMSAYSFARPGQHGFLLGTDQFGRSELSRIAAGIRTSLVISTISIGLSSVVGTLLGLLSAQLRWFDMIVMRVMDIFMAFPAILLAIGIMAMVGPGISGVIEAIAIVYLPIFARVSRGPALEEAQKEYVEAERSMGASNARILIRHVLINIWPIIIIQISLAVSDAILIEAALSYLGLGVVPPASSLGELLQSGQTSMFNDPWTAIFPGLAIAVAVLGFNLLGDAIRDRFAVR